MSERHLQTAIRSALAWAPDLCLWRNAQVARGNVKGGLGTGSADLVGILRVDAILDSASIRDQHAGTMAPVGRFFALEVKLPGEEPSAAQVEWMVMVRLFGGFACVVRSVAEAMAALERARRGASE